MKAEREFLFGIHSVQEALSSGSDIDKIFVRKDSANPAIREVLLEAYQSNIPILKVPKEKLNSITGKNHQGIIAYLSAVRYASLDHVISSSYGSGKDPLLLMLDRITDVHNFGAIARTAEGLGFDALIVPFKGGARLNNEAVKISSGALMHIPVCRVKSLLSTLDFLQKNGIMVIACTEKASTTIYNTELTGPACLVLGSESEGISKELLEKSNASIRIPMYGQVSSFNVSVSMAIAGAELVRQRQS